MAFTIRVFNQADSKYYTVTVDVVGATPSSVNGSPVTSVVDYYMKITTSMKNKLTGASYPEYMIRTLADVPVGYNPTTFTELIQDYIDYFVTGQELGMSTSSSSGSSLSSSSLSSLSSSSISSGSSSSNSSSSSYIENWSSSSISSDSSDSSSSISSDSSDSSSSISSLIYSSMSSDY